MDKLPEKLEEAITADLEDTRSEAEIARDFRVKATGYLQRQLHDNAVALKGLYVDWCFTKLNLTKYR